MGLSGLLAGAVLFSAVALAAGILSLALPMWLITRKELHNKLCWTGEGLWTLNYVWGVDIPEMNGYKCEGEALNAHDYYCNGVGSDEADSDYRSQMCKATNLAKGLAIASLFAGTLAFLCAYLSYRGSRTFKQASRNIYRVVSNLASPTPPPAPIQASVVAAAARVTYNNNNNNNASVEENVTEAQDDDAATASTSTYSERPSSPSVEDATTDFRDEYRIAMAATGATLVAATTGAGAFFVMYSSPLFSASHAYEISKHDPVPFPNAEFGCYFQSPLRTMKISDIIHSSPLSCLFGGPAFALGAASFVCWYIAALMFFLMARDVKRLLGITLAPEIAVEVAKKTRIVGEEIFVGVMYPRHYSLHGALSRKFESLPPIRRRLIVMLLPLITFATAAIFTWMMCSNGAAVQVFIRMSSPLINTQAEAEAEMVRMFPRENARHPAWRFDAQSKRIEIIEEVFDFTMLTSIKNFWDGKAYALALLTCIFCMIWPFLRVFIHLLFFFVPIPEFERGRTLTWLDGLGKWTLVNHFILCFMGVAFRLSAVIKPVGNLLNVGVDVVLAPRLATYLFIIGVLFSIVLSQAYVWVHRKCKEWEEARRYAADVKRRARAVAQSRSHTSQQQFTQFQPSDTPFMDGVGFPMPPPSASPAAGSSISTGSTTSNPQPFVLSPPSIRYFHGYGFEALCDRHHVFPGKGRVEYTPLAKVLIWIALGFCVSTTLAGMLQVSVAFTFGGIVGEVLVDERDRHREYSLFSTGVSIETDVGAVHSGKLLLEGVFFLTALTMPLLRLFGLAMLWYVPMRPQQQKFWFHAMELIDSWSALDVYLVSTLAGTLEIGNLSQAILGGSFPSVEELVEKALPTYGGLFVVNQSLLNGMFLLVTGVLMEKLMSLFIVAQTAAAVSERLAEESLAAQRKRMVPTSREEEDVTRELGAHPETLLTLSPAARYTSASAMPKVMFSGIPAPVWRVGSWLGLVREVEGGSTRRNASGSAVMAVLPGNLTGVVEEEEREYFSLEAS